MARSVIASGSKWRIDNGESVNVWIDPWIKDIPTSKTTTLVIDGLEDLRVSTLCFKGLPSWNIGLLRALFNEHDVKAISKMLLPSENMDDKII